MYDHQPSTVIAYLPGDRALATTRSEDAYFVVQADGTHERVAPARAAALYQQRLTGEEAVDVETEHKRRKMIRILSDGEDLAARRQRIRRARKSRARERAHDPKITKHIRIADKERELQARIEALESLLARADAQTE